MTYDKTHTEDECDKCGASVGKNQLFLVPFLYCDKNDSVHPDLSETVGVPHGEGYRQYYVCINCVKTVV